MFLIAECGETGNIMNTGQGKTLRPKWLMPRIPTKFLNDLPRWAYSFNALIKPLPFCPMTTKRKKRRKTATRRTKLNTAKQNFFRLIIVAAFIGLAVMAALHWDFVEETWYEIKDIIEETSQQTTNNPPPPAPIPNPQPTPNPSPNPTPIPGTTPKSVKIVTWNLYNMGISKDDDEVRFAAEVLKNYDIVALQEISTTLNGPRAIAKLNEELNRRGAKWDYIISDPTSGEGSERYTFLYKTKHIQVRGSGWLAKDRGLADKIAREPYLARFDIGKKQLLLANFHAVPVNKNPAAEIVHLVELPTLYPKDNLLIMGDFNLSEKNAAFNQLKAKGYKPVLQNQKTSLKTKPDANGNYLAAEYDNLFYKTGTLNNLKSGIIDFVPLCKNLSEARQISDHLPVWCEISWR